MTATFPIVCLTPINTIPTWVYLTKIQTELNSNATSIVSATSPTYGYLVLTVTPATYVTYATNNFPAPINLGLNSTYAAEVLSDTIREASCRHLIHRAHYDTYHAADKSLRK